MSTPPQTATQQLLADIWQRNLPLIHARLDLLDRAAAAALAGALTRPGQEEAAATAHKLAGSLGMYGFPLGSALAHSLESEYELPVPAAQTLLTLTQDLRQAIFPTSK